MRFIKWDEVDGGMK
jgi:hypothetical protein